jgi:hypothetical protein
MVTATDSEPSRWSSINVGSSCASGAPDASSAAIRTRPAFGLPKLSSSAAVSETRLVRRSLAADFGVPFYRAWSGRAQLAATSVNEPIGRIPSWRTAPEMYR